MTWPLRFRSDPEPWMTPQIGDCWYAPSTYKTDHLSDQYKADWLGKRPPIVVYMPPGFPFYVDSRVSGETRGWTVTGSIEDSTLTLTPSVNFPGDYHGFIQGGQVTDDVEGRTFA